MSKNNISPNKISRLLSSLNIVSTTSLTPVSATSLTTLLSTSLTSAIPTAFALAPTAFALSLILPAAAEASAWSTESDPYRLDPSYLYFFDALPKAATLAPETQPWSGPFWPTRDGVTAYRWQTHEKGGSYTPPSAARVKTMTADELQKLSPAEKFDILRGDYNYRTVKTALEYADRANRAKSFPWIRLRNWQGICNGYSQAAAQIQEPVSTNLVSADGISIPFTSGDLKAISSFYYEDPNGGQIDHNAHTRRLGTKCTQQKLFPYLDCRRDLNAGALHVAITNQIGLIGDAIFGDFARGRQVWQHPIYGYSFDKTGERPARKDAAPSAVREVEVRMELFMGDYSDPSTAATPMRTKTRKLRYWVEIDADGNIVGGKFIDVGAGRPVDYLWVSDRLEFKNGYELLNPALKPKLPSPPLHQKPARHGGVSEDESDSQF